MQGEKLNLDKNILKRLYEGEVLSTKAIAERLGCGQTSIKRYLEKFGIPRRRFQDSIKLSHNLGRVSFNHAKGNHHGNWKGGRRIHSKGYILIYDPTHHRANKNRYVYEHIKVWEEANGKILPNGWQVHHINGKKADNRPNNLFALPIKNHNKLALLLETRRKVCKLESEIEQLKAQQIMKLGENNGFTDTE